MSHKSGFAHYVRCPACEKQVRVTGAMRCCILTAVIERNRVGWYLRPVLSPSPTRMPSDGLRVSL